MRRGMKLGRGIAIALAAAGLATTAGAQTTNYWLNNADGSWNSDANWTAAPYPSGADSVAIFTNDFSADRTVTLASDVTLNSLMFNDAGASGDSTLFLNGKKISFVGSQAFLTSSNTSGTSIRFNTTTMDVSAVTLTVDMGATVPFVFAPLTGNGTFVLVRGGVNFRGINSNFTGSIVVSNLAGASANVDAGAGAGYWGFGDTNAGTYIYDQGIVRALRDASNVSNAEPFHVYGVNPNGSIRFFNSTNSTYFGVVSLYTNGAISILPYENWPTAIQYRRDSFYTGTLRDDGNSRNVHLLQDTAGSSTATGTISRMSQLVFGGVATHGGYTHLSNTKAPDTTGTFDMYLQLTNGNNRLPVTTTVFLGGQTNDQGRTIGAVGASGILILAGADQEVAGLYTLGNGTQNRVVGGMPTNNTLALNIASGTTNRYTGYLGGDMFVSIGTFTNAGGTFSLTNSWGQNNNNLNLTKKGAGLLELAAVSNTYAGTTTVEAGTLKVSGNNPNPGTVTVKSGGTLIMNGDWRASGLITVDNGGTFSGDGTVGGISSSGTVSPGNSPGTLTSYGNVTLNTGSILTMELQDPLMDPYDTLVMNGGVLTLSGTPELSLSLYGGYTPNLGDSFTILSGFVGSAGDFDTAFDGTFNGKPDGATFSVSGSTFQIDYNANDITLTVVPEPATLGLLGLAALGGLLRRRIRR